MKRLPPPPQVPSFERADYFERFEFLVQAHDSYVRNYECLPHARGSQEVRILMLNCALRRVSSMSFSVSRSDILAGLSIGITAPGAACSTTSTVTKSWAGWRFSRSRAKVEPRGRAAPIPPKFIS